ncbi:MAG: acyl-CoA dehydratase activase [Thermodesulfobacteriota bacterium]
MPVAGIDVGSLTAKAVIVENGEILGSAVVPGSPRPGESATLALGKALENAGVKREAITYIVGTGYGRKQIGNVNEVHSEIACHARGAYQRLPSVRTVIDIGGQDAKAARIAEGGAVARYAYNDKCASGTGRFLEVMAEALEKPIETLGDLALSASGSVRISNQCVVFAETEVISLVNKGIELGSIIRGLHEALAGRVAALARSIGVEKEVCFTGGVAKNKGVAKALEDALGVPLRFLDLDPQITGAYGAALLAEEATMQKKSA